MPDKDLEAIITEVLESYQLIKNQEGEAPTIVRGGKLGNFDNRRAMDRRAAFIVPRRKRRPSRNPLRTSLRLIFVGLVVLCVPLLFSV